MVDTVVPLCSVEDGILEIRQARNVRQSIWCAEKARSADNRIVRFVVLFAVLVFYHNVPLGSAFVPGCRSDFSVIVDVVHDIVLCGHIFQVFASLACRCKVLWTVSDADLYYTNWSKLTRPRIRLFELVREQEAGGI